MFAVPAAGSAGLRAARGGWRGVGAGCVARQRGGGTSVLAEDAPARGLGPPFLGQGGAEWGRRCTFASP